MAIHDVELPQEQTTLFYYLELKDGGIIQTYPGTAFEKRRKHVPHEATIRDLRTVKDQFKVDNCGFEIISHHTSVKDFTNKAEVEEKYYPEVREIIRKA
jgi:hypothetical protein